MEICLFSPHISMDQKVRDFLNIKSGNSKNLLKPFTMLYFSTGILVSLKIYEITHLQGGREEGEWFHDLDNLIFKNGLEVAGSESDKEN